MESKFSGKAPQEVKSFGWEEGSNQIFNSRGLNTYEQLLLFRAEDLEGKRVLDLGAHKDETIARQLKARNINSHIVSYSPDFSLEQYRDKNVSREKMPAVAGVAQQLPFRAESFDYILDLGGPSLYVYDSERLLYLQEVIRVLSKGGKYLTHLSFKENVDEFDEVKILLEQQFKDIKIKIIEVKSQRGMPFGYKWEIEK
jgi:SAM-dependent methyltransferase